MREQITPECLRLTVRELIGIEPHRLDKAFARVRHELKFFPKPVEILERLPLDIGRRDAEERSPNRPVN